MPVRAALAQGVKMISFGNFVQFGKPLTLLDSFHTPNCERFRQAFDTLDQPQKRLARAERSCSSGLRVALMPQPATWWPRRIRTRRLHPLTARSTSAARPGPRCITVRSCVRHRRPGTLRRCWARRHLPSITCTISAGCEYLALGALFVDWQKAYQSPGQPRADLTASFERLCSLWSLWPLCDTWQLAAAKMLDSSSVGV